MAANGRIGKVGFVSLGCPKALVDTERVVTELRAEGYLIAVDYKEADIVIVAAGKMETIGEAYFRPGQQLFRPPAPERRHPWRKGSAA